MQRNTLQRTLVLRNVRSRLDHPTAEDVYNDVRREISNISLTTVYRNLNNLADEGLIIRITVPNKPDRFDQTVRSHCHVFCTRCGAFSDVEDFTVADDIRKLVKEKENFLITDSDILFKGICRKCRAADEAEEQKA